MVTVAVCAGACGSASGGMGVAFKALKDTYLKLGASLPDIHRISTIAAGTLDTLPHQGAQITLLGICKLTHKEAYWDIAVTQIFIPLIDCLVSVSYTHLDVYKRQVQHLTPCPCTSVSYWHNFPFSITIQW